MNEDPSIYTRPMTLEEISAENAKYQRDLHERMAKELPEAMGAYINNYDDDDEEIEEEIDEETDNSRCNGQQNRNGFIGNKYSENVPYQPSEPSLMLAVREREIQELRKDKEERLKKYESELKNVKDNLAHASLEKQRATVSLKEAQDLLFTLKTQNTLLLEEKEKLIDSENNLKAELQLQKLTIQDKDKILKVLENGSQDNRQIYRLEKQLQAKDEKHQIDIKNLNDQLELSFKKCKSMERDVYELEKKVKCLDERNDEILTQKAETISKLTAQIQNLSSDYQSLVTESQNNDRKLRAEIGLKEKVEQNLMAEIETLKTRLGILPDTDNNGSDLQSRLLELERKLASSKDDNHKLNGRIIEMEKELIKRNNRITELLEANFKTELSLEMYNSQYLKFHEEEMNRQRTRLEDEFHCKIKEKEEMIEALKSENEDVKKLYITREDEFGSIDVQKLQSDLEMASARFIQLQKTHSEYCQPELTNREKAINELTDENKNLTTKLANAENEQDDIKSKLSIMMQDNVEKDNQLNIGVREMESLKEKLENILTAQTEQLTQINNLKEEILRKEFFYHQQLEAMKKVAVTTTRNKIDAETSTERISDCRKSSSTSPLMKTWTETEVAKILQDIALLHEQEQRQYEIRLEALHQNLLSMSQGQKPRRDAGTETENTSEISSELTQELWKTLEKLRQQNEVLTARTQSSETEFVLSRMNEQLVAAARRNELVESERQQMQQICQKLTEKEARLRNELSTLTEKYEKLKSQAKHYKEYFSNVISKLKDENKKERRLWQEERNDLEDRLKIWEAEKEKREKALLELQADVKSLKVPAPAQAVSVQDLLDKLMETIINDKQGKKVIKK